MFAYLADLPRHSEWAAHRLKIEPVSDGAIGVGSKFRSVGHAMGQDSNDEVTVTEYAPVQRLAFEAVSKEGRFRHTFDLQPEGGATHISKSVQVVEASLMTKLMTPVIALTAPGILAKDLKRIKAKLE